MPFRTTVHKVVKLTKTPCTDETCTFAGRIHPRCAAHRATPASTGQRLPCMKWPEAANTTCNYHGGNRKQPQTNANIRQAVKLAHQLVDFNPLDTESIEDGLVREVRWSSQIAQAYALAIKRLEDEELVTDSYAHGQQMHALVQAWTQERTLHVKFAKACLDAGIDQRKLELAEFQAAAVVRTLMAVFDAPELGLSFEQRQQARKTAADYLRSNPQLDPTLSPPTTAVDAIVIEATARANRAATRNPTQNRRQDEASNLKALPRAQHTQIPPEVIHPPIAADPDYKRIKLNIRKLDNFHTPAARANENAAPGRRPTIGELRHYYAHEVETIG